MRPGPTSSARSKWKVRRCQKTRPKLIFSAEMKTKIKQELTSSDTVKNPFNQSAISLPLVFERYTYNRRQNVWDTILRLKEKSHLQPSSLPSISKLRFLFFLTGSSNIGKTFLVRGWGGESFIFPPSKSEKGHKGPLRLRVLTNFVADCSYLV